MHIEQATAARTMLDAEAMQIAQMISSCMHLITARVGSSSVRARQRGPSHFSLISQLGLRILKDCCKSWLISFPNCVISVSTFAANVSIQLTAEAWRSSFVQRANTYLSRS